MGSSRIGIAISPRLSVAFIGFVVASVMLVLRGVGYVLSNNFNGFLAVSVTAPAILEVQEVTIVLINVKAVRLIFPWKQKTCLHFLCGHVNKLQTMQPCNVVY